MRVPVHLSSNTISHHQQARYFQNGGALPHYMQGGTGWSGLWSGVKKFALPTLKAIGKAALPMAKQAFMAGLSAKVPLKSRFKAAAQSAATKQNVLHLGKVGLTAARPSF